MKGKIIIPAIVTIFSFLGVTYTSCIKDHCTGTLCANGGICVNGACACATGYEGAHCDTLWSYKFSGKWNITESTQDSNGVHEGGGYAISVRSGGTGDVFLIDNLEGVVDSIYCTTVNNREFSIPSQSNADSSFIVYSGDGKLDTASNTVTVDYIFIRNGLRTVSNMTWGR